MFSFLAFALQAILTSAMLGLLFRASFKSQPYSFSEVGGHIKPGKVSAAITVVAGLIFMGAGFVATLAGEFGLGICITVLGACISGFMLPSLGNRHDVVWTDQEIYGPCKQFGPTLAFSRTRIEWAQIVKMGITSTQYWFVEAADGRRVYWSYLYRGHAKFSETISRKRPDLHR